MASDESREPQRPRRESQETPSVPNSPTQAAGPSFSTPQPSQQLEDAQGLPPRSLDGLRRKTSLGSESTPSEAVLSPDVPDRVFPIRSYVSVQPTPAPQQESREGYFAAQQRRPSGVRPPSTSGNRGGRQPKEHTTSQGEETDERHSTISEDEPIHSPTYPPRSYAAERTTATTGQQPYQILSDQASGHSESVSSRPPSRKADAPSPGPPSVRSVRSGRGGRESRQEESSGLYTARFKHIVTDGGHAVITGRDGETLQRCEDEPIHVPGAIQTFGALVALKEETEGKLVVRVASENSQRILGYTAQELFRCESFTDIMSEEQADNLLDHIDFIKDEEMDVEANGPEVFTLSIRTRARRSHKVWCAIHINQSQPDLYICEFELEDDHVYPLVPLSDADTPEPPEDTLQSDPTEEELRESTEIKSKPLRVLRSARKRRGEAAAMEVFNIMSQVQEQLAEAPNLDVFLKVLVGVVKELSGFHRVMVYQFDGNFNGKVVTELVDPRATRDLYKGLHFPASDIPKQARDLYRINKVRLLYDRDHETARLVCRTLEDLEKPLDMTHCYLRAMSPIHIKYLRNMAVRSSMSISINAFNELWGLISCHTYGTKGTRVSFPIRKMCRLVGDSASRNIERLSYASRLQARKLINTSPTSKNPSGYIIASSDDLLKLFDANFGLLSIYDETKILGKLEATQEALALLEYLRIQKFTSITMSRDIRVDFPDLVYPPGFKVIAGLLLVPLTATGEDFIVFFREGQSKEVKWAGNPYEKFIREGTEGFLEPRASFKVWSETVVGQCREWTDEEMDTAAVLCLVYGKFIEVWRQKEAALQSTQLTKLLLANSAHEVRTPLNAIINYLEIAMEGQLDSETRDNLSRSHSASKSLIYVINDLLDLTKTEQHAALVNEEMFDLPATFNEAAEMFRGDAKRKRISLDIFEHEGVPVKVLGDQRRVRQAISNVTANAIQATKEGGVKVEMAVVGRERNRVEVEVIVTDTGTGMTQKQLDSLFNELEQVQQEDNAPIEEALIPQQTLPTEGSDSKRTLGLGLAVVARIIKNMNGQLRLKSEEGKGTRFVIQFPFDIPDEEEKRSQRLSKTHLLERPNSAEGKDLPRETSPSEGELTLIAKASTSRRGSDGHASPPTLSRTGSSGSAVSLGRKSMSSINSGRSEADRLIEAMQEPVGERPSLGHRSRSGGRASRDLKRSSYSSGGGSPARHRSRSADRPSSAKVPEHLRTQPPSSPGTQNIASSRSPLKPIRMPDEGSMSGGFTSPAPLAHFLPSQSKETSQQLSLKNMNVLVAEDDPVNSKIIKKRLEKLGHIPHLTVNGEECASAYGETSDTFDCILMDIQMPIVDGLTSTKMIRSFEKTQTAPLSVRAACNGRVPIIAVSASLLERDRQTYIDAGFDAWILKPISFARLTELMTAIVDDQARRKCLYQPGNWERGGWFHEGVSSAAEASTAPSETIPSSNPSSTTQQSAEEGSST